MFWLFDWDSENCHHLPKLRKTLQGALACSVRSWAKRSTSCAFSSWKETWGKRLNQRQNQQEKTFWHKKKTSVINSAWIIFKSHQVGSLPNSHQDPGHTPASHLTRYVTPTIIVSLILGLLKRLSLETRRKIHHSPLKPFRWAKVLQKS